MYPKITAVVCLAMLCLGCGQENNLAFDSLSFTERDLDLCQDRQCPEVTINYVEAQGDDAVSEKINRKIQHFIFASLLMGEDSIPTAKSLQEAARGFVESYFNDKAQFPDMAGAYFAEISVNQLYASDEILCFEMRQYLFTGGAHGYGTTSFLNINPQTGSELGFDDLFRNKSEFLFFAERKFRNQQNIPATQSINDTGFWFEDDSFSLPESVGVTQDSLIFVYNQYDIASYADGPIELRIARSDAQPYLRID